MKLLSSVSVFSRQVQFIGAVILIASNALAQNLFVSSDSGPGTITEITPGGVQSTFASGLLQPTGLAFNSAGNLFVASGSDNIYEYTPGGVQSTFASGLSEPVGLAFQGETLPVPEPSALGLLAVGAASLFFRRRKLAA
jgi:hypothetical protein